MTIGSSQSPGTAGKLGGILVYIFVLCFGLVGVVTGVLAARSFLDGDYGKGAFLGIFALTFGGFGFAMGAFMIEGRKKAKKTLELRATFPSEPWKWREDWASGSVRCTTKSTMIFAWGFAILWNLISTPLLLILPSEILGEANYPALLGLLFPLVGIGLLVWAGRETVEWKKFGPSVFRMDSVPGVIGGGISGTVDVSTGFDPDQVFGVTLASINRRTTGAGKNSSTTESILWQEKRDSVRPLARPEAMGAGIPVRFEIPYDCVQSNDDNPNNLFLWRLEVHAAVPGVDYDAKFDVPIFKTAASRAPASGMESSESLPRATSLQLRPEFPSM